MPEFLFFGIAAGAAMFAHWGRKGFGWALGAYVVGLVFGAVFLFGYSVLTNDSTQLINRNIGALFLIPAAGVLFSWWARKTPIPEKRQLGPWERS